MDFYRDECYLGATEAAYTVCRRVIPAGDNPFTTNIYPDYERKWVARWMLHAVQIEIDRTAVANSSKQGQIIVPEILINGNIARSLMRIKTGILDEGGRLFLHFPGGIEVAGVCWFIYSGGVVDGDHVCTKIAYEPVLYKPGERRRDVH